ncbi:MULTISPECIES: toll/interleukin-1 receptor domain-containing protein [unclassified Pseudomonas]|uniref:toll/interleukin-1 receptor domain-containing protein n=1 Tax=unclassified Pseudomonas TaxID=196821 RepID=UPI000A1D7BDE|nr:MULTISPECIES: toll/interleukin-1 receptor domain-containing protein [unclassified Pseudomonas]
MKVFVSWSGRRSKVVAELLSDWIKCVLQASQPWISTRDIDKGAIWFSEISDQLRETAAGIVCLTQENKNKPWILFETGALAKGLSTNRVCTFLIDLSPSDIEDPLAQFNHTMPDRTSMWGLISSLNGCLEGARLDERILRQVFDTYWPNFEKTFAEALVKTPQEVDVEPRSGDSILSEILANTRMLSSRVRELESRVSISPEPVIETGPMNNKLYIHHLVKNTSVPIQQVIEVAKTLGVPYAEVEEWLNIYRVVKLDGKGKIVVERPPKSGT